jgi:hypothetical protein
MTSTSLFLGQYVLNAMGWNETDNGGAVGVVKIEEGNLASQRDWVWRLP